MSLFFLFPDFLLCIDPIELRKSSAEACCVQYVRREQSATSALQLSALLAGLLQAASFLTFSRLQAQFTLL